MKKLINRVLSLAFAAIMLATPAVADSDWKSGMLDEFMSLMEPLMKAHGLKEDNVGALKGGLNGAVGGVCVGAGGLPTPLPETTVQKALRLYEGMLRDDDIDMQSAREVMSLCLTHMENAFLAAGASKQEARFFLEGYIRQMLHQFKGQLEK